MWAGVYIRRIGPGRTTGRYRWDRGSSLWVARRLIAVPVSTRRSPTTGSTRARAGRRGGRRGPLRATSPSATHRPGALQARDRRARASAREPRQHDPRLLPGARYLFSENGAPRRRPDRGAAADRDQRAERHDDLDYNAQFPGPTWVACPGDPLNVNVQNDMTRPTTTGMHPGETNLHTHGFHVSPRRPQRQHLRTIRRPGQTFQYQYNLPLDHPPGAYWYHPHVHGQTNPQVYGGMAGGDHHPRRPRRPSPGYRNIGTRDLVIQQTTLNDDGTTEQPGPRAVHPARPERRGADLPSQRRDQPGDPDRAGRAPALADLQRQPPAPS